MQDHGATCELWPPTRSRHLRGTRASPTALAVSREVANFASLPRARAPYSAGDGRTTHNIMALHQRKASLIRCETVVRRASCGFQHAAGFRVARACAILRWLSFGRWQNTRAGRARARHATLVVVSLRTLESTALARGLSLSAQDRGATCELWLSTHGRLSHGTRLRNTALAVFREVAKHASWPRARAPCYAGHGRLTHLTKYCTGGRPLTFGTRPWFDVRAVTSSAQPAFAWHFNRRHCAGCLSGGGETRELAARARLAVLAVVGSRTTKIRCTGGRRLIFGARPWCDVRAVASNTQPASRDRRTSATTLAVFEDVAKDASLLCARVVLRWL